MPSNRTFKTIRTVALTLAVSSSCFCMWPEAVVAQDYASPERRSAALGHYARARSLLVEALKEFEMGRKLARPDLLVDPEEWRISVLSRTEELNGILDPKPRVSRQGVRFRAEKLLIQPEQQRRSLPDGLSPRDSNQYGEIQRRREVQAARKSGPPAKIEQTEDVPPTVKDNNNGTRGLVDSSPLPKDQFTGPSKTNADLGASSGRNDPAYGSGGDRVKGSKKADGSDPEKKGELLDIYVDEFPENSGGEDEKLLPKSEDVGKEVKKSIAERMSAKIKEGRAVKVDKERRSGSSSLQVNSVQSKDAADDLLADKILLNVETKDREPNGKATNEPTDVNQSPAGSSKENKSDKETDSKAKKEGFDDFFKE